MDDLNITMEEYIRLEEEKARRHGQVYNWETATYDKIWYDEDVHDLRSVETEFPAIVYNDALTSEVTLSCEPTVEFKRISLTGFRSCTSRSHYRSVSKQTTRISQVTYRIACLMLAMEEFPSSLNSREVILRLGDIRILLVTFFTQLDIFDSLLDDETPGEHTEFHRQVNNNFTIEME
ncbi:hypothetical protein Tco_0356527 [Tanacetum coccineum]